MTAAIYIGKEGLETDPRLTGLIEELSAGGWDTYRLVAGERPREGTGMVLSIGGDGTFLSVAMAVAGSGLPVVGVNLGRVGFLSENRPEDVAKAVLAGDYHLEDRPLLKAEVSTGCPQVDSWPYALNEFTVHRSGAAMLGVDVRIDGTRLPTYWADGLIVSTSSGSTAYSLSAGGPIVLPESRVLIITPIAPHNLNVRPLIVPDTAEIMIGMRSRDPEVIFTADNRTAKIGVDTQICISVAQFSLKRVRLNRSDFINALTEKLFWGEDIRNNK